jgi:hypothetical protein
MNMTPVQRYARAATRIDAAKIAGQQPDPRDVATVVELETWANSTFNPQQLGMLGGLVAQARAEYVEEVKAENTVAAERDTQIQGYRQSKAAQLAQALRDAGMRDLTRHGFQEGAPGKAGLSQQQFHDLKDHGKYVNPGVERHRARIKRQVAQFHDVRVTDADINRARQWASDLMDATEAERNQMLDKAGVSNDIVERNAFVRDITSKLIAAELKERAEARAPKEVFEPKVIEDRTAQRRARIISEVERHHPNEVAELLVDRIEPSSLADDSSRGDVARAMAAHEPVDADYAEVEAIADGRA